MVQVRPLHLKCSNKNRTNIIDKIDSYLPSASTLRINKPLERQ